MQKHPVPSDAQSNEYATPRWLTRDLAETLPTEGDKFDLDPASGAEDQPHAHERLTKDDDGLSTPWHGWVWLNPPWSSPANDGRMKTAWLRRVVCHIERDSVDGVIMLLPDDVSTEWFDQYASTADYITFCGRVKFNDVGKNPAFGSMLLAWEGTAELPEATIRVLADIGPTFEGPALTGRQREVSEW